MTVRNEKELRSWLANSTIVRKANDANELQFDDPAIDELNSSLGLAVGDTVFLASRRVSAGVSLCRCFLLLRIAVLTPHRSLIRSFR